MEQKSKEVLAREAAGILVSWYREQGRHFPWRDEPSPYHVWISEIMLQQTRTAAVMPYYDRFLAELPNVAALAAVEDDRLMKLWEGLGYYSRARNLKRAAEEIMQKYGGVLPNRAETLEKLPGIGPYTAGAIASIAFGQPSPAVDGNVLRVMARLLADGRDVLDVSMRRDMEALLAGCYPAAGEDCRNLTQGLMELGEVVCVPAGKPGCEGCPVRELCRARQENLVDKLPYRSPARPRRTVEKTVFLLFRGDRVAIAKRPSKGLLAGLWEFPNADEHLSEEKAREYLTERGLSPALLQETPRARHVFTHLEWHMTGFRVDCGDVGGDEETCPEKSAKDARSVSENEDREAILGAGDAFSKVIWVTADELRRDYAIASAFRPFVDLL